MKPHGLRDVPVGPWYFRYLTGGQKVTTLAHELGVKKDTMLAWFKRNGLVLRGAGRPRSNQEGSHAA